MIACKVCNNKEKQISTCSVCNYLKDIDTKNEQRQLYLSTINKTKLTNFNIDLKLPIAWAAAKYYVLNYLSLEDRYNYEPKFKAFCQELAPKFYAYSFLAIGGEVRHMKLYACWRGLGGWKIVLKELPTELKKKLWLGSQSIRSNFWLTWLKLVEVLPQETLLDSAQDLFTKFTWGCSFGGESWAGIARHALGYLRCEHKNLSCKECKNFINKTCILKGISTVVFVDTCWGLQHNGGIYFDKLYNVDAPLKTVLNWGRNEIIEPLVPFLSKSDPELVKATRDILRTKPKVAYVPLGVAPKKVVSPAENEFGKVPSVTYSGESAKESIKKWGTASPHKEAICTQCGYTWTQHAVTSCIHTALKGYPKKPYLKPYKKIVKSKVSEGV